MIYTDRFIQQFSFFSVFLQIMFLTFPNTLPNTYTLSVFTAFIGSLIMVNNQVNYPESSSFIIIVGCHLLHCVPLFLHIMMGLHKEMNFMVIIWLLLVYIIVFTPRFAVCLYSNLQDFLQKKKNC